MMINNNKPINRDNLAIVTTELKRVLHPTIITDSYEDKVAIKVTSDISFEDQFPLSFYIKCFNFIDEEEKVIFAHGYIDNNNNNSTVNLGSSKITKIAVDQDENCIVFLTEERSAILKTEAEIFISTDNKNHINAIEYLTSEEIETYTFQDIQGDSDINFEYIVKTGEDEYVTIEQGGEGRIESIFHSTESESLDHPIELTIIGKDLNNNTVIQEITVSLDTNRNASNNIELTLDTDVLADTIKDSILADFPVASTSEIGGIKLDPTLSEDNKYPVQLDDDTKVAYVDLSNYQPNILLDKHRYDLNSVDPHTETTLVLHIGANSQDYITGYYYKWAPTSIDTINFVTTGWYVPNQNVLKQQLMQFDVEHDYILEDPRDRVAYILIYLKDELNIGDPITSTTNFSIKQETWFEEDITYKELNDLGFYLIKDNPNYGNYTGNTNDYLILINTLVFTQPTWRLKNVQPMLKVGSPLVFKGTATWAQLQQYAATADPGDFYIVTDKSNLEWYWTGTNWEFMGDIFTLDGSFVVKTKNTSGETTVQTFKATDSGEQPIIFKEGSNVTLTPNDTTHIIEIAATDTTYVASDFDIKDLSDSTGLRTTWSGKQDVISAGDNIDITNDTVSAKGYVLTDGLNSFSEGDKTDTNRSKAKGQNSHAEGYLTRAISPYSHSEGLQTIALGYASHVEGQGRLVDLGPIDTLEHTNDEFTVKQQYINNFVVGDIVECNGGFSRISNVEYLWLTVYLESPINEAHTGDHVYSVSGAFGENSHSEGTGTITINSSEHAEGKYNVSNTNTIHSIGIGAASARKNATEVMTNGDMYLYGVGGYDGTNPSSADTLQESLGDKNIIESVLINGTDLTPSNKAVNITVTSSNNTASFGSAVTVGTVSGVDLKFTMPANPNTDTQADWNETDNTNAAYINNKPSLATVATSGSYSDLNNTPTIPTVNNNSIMFATKSGSTLNLFSAFTLNLNYDKKIILEEGSNITLTPDDPNNIVRIDAANTTYSFSQSGNTLTITPSSGNASTYTPTFTDLDEKLKISKSASKMYLTGVTAEPTSTEVAYKGVANTGVYSENGNLHLDGNISNSCIKNYYVQQSSTGPVIDTLNDNEVILPSGTAINTPIRIILDYSSKKYRYILLSSESYPLYIDLKTANTTFEGVKEVVCRITRPSSVSLQPHIYVINSGINSITNMYTTQITDTTGSGVSLNAGASLELVFTFWDVDDVSFNGGISV